MIEYPRDYFCNIAILCTIKIADANTLSVVQPAEQKELYLS